jgi:hypothetical protein
MKQLLVLVTLIFLSGCELMDVTSQSLQAMEEWQPAVQSSSGQPGNKQEIAINPNAALITAGGATRNKGDCQPTWGGIRGRRDFITVNAGTVTIDGECQARILPDIFGRRRRMSSFEFVAEAGHTYTITATEKECMSLLDITSEEIVVACEPYEKSK